jgi:NAD(P)-dependent dehydrogenase (short-subunit alcohol dehydrogenase family)
MDKKVWFITGAGRGMGLDFAKAVLGAGHAVVATGRDPRRLADQLGNSGDLLTVKLDITDPGDAAAATMAAVERFGRIDVLINNAAIFEAGFFEELTLEQIDRTLSANLVGQMHVTRAMLPVMRRQGSGHVITISSTAGLASGVEFTSAYAASKFALERRSRRSAFISLSLTRGSSAPSCCPNNRRGMPSHPYPTMTRAERH